jgi:predicted DNA-binding protein
MFMIHIKRIAYWLAFHSLNRAAHFGGGDATFGVRILLRNRLEDLTDIIIATHRLKDIRAGRSQMISLAELAAEYGLADSADNH